MWVGTTPWSSTSSAASVIAILAKPHVSITNVVCTGLIGDGITDNATSLQACLDNHTTSDGPGQIAYINVPTGTFSLSASITLRSGEVLKGSSSGITEFIAHALGPPKRPWFIVRRNSGLANLSIRAPTGTALIASSDTTGDPSISGHLFISKVVCSSTPQNLSSREPMLQLYGPDIQIYDSTFASGSRLNLMIKLGDGAILSGNTFDNTVAYNNIEASQNIIIESNTVSSTSGPGENANDAFSISRPFCQSCRSMLSQDIYIGYNSFSSMGSPDMEIVTQDGGGQPAYYGLVASSTSNAVTLAKDPSWIWIGDTNPAAASIQIISGRGVGQYSILQSYTGRILTLAIPWSVSPDSTSVVVIQPAQRNLTIANNAFTDTLGVSINIGGSFENVVEDNSLTDSGRGIRVMGPALNTDILRNLISPGSRTFITESRHQNKGGIGIHNGMGTIVSGMMVRGNTPAGHSDYLQYEWRQWDQYERH